MLLLAFLPLLATVQAQNEGEVLYNEIIKMNIELPEEHEHLRAMLPKSQTLTKQLLFTADKLMYKDVEQKEDDDDMMAEQGNVQVKMMVLGSENQLFKDLKTGTVVERRDFMGKRFLIKDAEQNSLDWKLTGEQREILGYPCQKAVFADSTDRIEAWFTTAIPLAIGPDKFGKLPGLILEINKNDGQRTIRATKVELKDIDDTQIKAPKKGKVVTSEEFIKIIEEKSQETPGTRVMTIRSN